MGNWRRQWDMLAQDLRFAIRNFRRSPAFFSLVIGILALGIGASVAIFSLVDGILLRPLPYRDPGRLFMLTTYAPRPPFSSNGSISYNDFRQFQAKSRPFSDLAITFRTGWSRVTLTGSAGTVHMQGAFVSPNLFAMVGRAPILGRTFTAEEDRLAERVIAISESLWAERFGSSPNVLGQDLEIDHLRWRIVGVMPSDFQLPFLDTQVWAPLHSHPEWNNNGQSNFLEGPWWDVIARLKPGISPTRAQAEVASIWNGLRAALPIFEGNDVHLVPLRKYFTGRVEEPILVLFGAAAFLLTIACANVANLLLARSAQRAREMAVRAALGAGYARLLRQLITEALAFSLVAAMIGAVLAVELVPLLKSLAPANMPLLNAVTLNGRGLLFASGLSILLGVLLGMAPLSRRELKESLSSGGRSLTETRRSRRLKNLLVAAEFAVAMVLLTGAGLLIHSFLAVLHVNLGFQPANLLTIQLNHRNDSRVDREVMQRISRLPGAQAVGGTSNLFYLDERRTHALRAVEGHPPEPTAAWKPLVWTQISGDYFRTMGIPLIRGRFFRESDGPNAPLVVIISQTLAQRYWPGEDPIGKHVKGFDPRGQHDDWLTVVGVVGDVRSGGLERAPLSQIYEPQTQTPGEQINHIVIRTAGNPATLAAAARAVIRSVDKNAVIDSVSSMELVIEQQEIQRRFQTWLLSAFSGIALLLAALGVFAVMHYSVAARTAEIGIRMALGATAADVTHLVLSGGTRLAVYGIAAGAFASIWLSRVIAGFLYGVTPSDRFSFAGAALVLLAVAAIASYLPANRASRIDPNTALRWE
ncbi:MAG TPA: ABC transporter permease [Bryobacteraceae bacterium]|nr:ABC transporter permease [Bryobacteraceae bacterium]